MLDQARPTDNKGSSKGFGRGKTLEEAAFDMGYWQNWDRYICSNCRKEEGYRVQTAMVREARSWSDAPFTYAVKAASRGLVFDDMSVPVESALDSWFKLNVPPEEVKEQRLVSPAVYPKRILWTKHYTASQPARYAPFELPGWEFPYTVEIDVELTLGYNETGTYRRYRGTVVALTNGDVYYDGVKHAHPPAEVGPLHLLVAMSHKISDHVGQEWHGVPYGVL